MTRTDRRIRLCTILIVCNLAFIWGNSLLPGEVSGAISDWVKDLLAALFAQGPEKPSSGGLLRKLAHFLEFTALGGLLCWRFAMAGKTWKGAFLTGAAAACIDETIQRFVPDRGPSLRDVCIDSAGVLTGIALLILGHTVLKKRSASNYAYQLEDNK